jgi:hypothetical protein
MTKQRYEQRKMKAFFHRRYFYQGNVFFSVISVQFATFIRAVRV